MKIDYENIHYNAQRLIDEYTGSPYEYADQSDDADHQRLVTLGYIRGIIEMAHAMEEVLKS